jgi:nitroreductase
MTRSFTDDPVDDKIIDHLLSSARFAPRAGNTQGIEYLVLQNEQVHEYWRTTFDQETKEGFPWPGLFQAPVLILTWVNPDNYVSRYAERDKIDSGLGDDVSSWSTPFWWVDGGMAAMTIMLGAEASGLGTLFFGLFEHENAVKRKFSVPDNFRSVGAIALGVPAEDQRKSNSTKRVRKPLANVVHLGGWGA